MLHVSGFLHLVVPEGVKMMTEEEITVEKLPEIHLKLTLETFHFRVKDSLEIFLISYTFHSNNAVPPLKSVVFFLEFTHYFVFLTKRDEGSCIEYFKSRSGYI